MPFHDRYTEEDPAQMKGLIHSERNRCEACILAFRDGMPGAKALCDLGKNIKSADGNKDLKCPVARNTEGIYGEISEI